MLSTLRVVFVITVLGFSAAGSWAAMGAETMKEDPVHVRNWNDFAQACLDLHERLVAEHAVEKSTSVGGYHGAPEFYREEIYRDADTGKIVSRVQWEREEPDNLHSIEVYVRDDKGRVMRDYGASFLTTHRNSPVQTLINLHNYEQGLHGFRQFDASGDRIYEFCEGRYQGKAVQIRLFEDDLVGTDPRMDRVMESAEYEACFGGLPASPGKYLTPQ